MIETMCSIQINLFAILIQIEFTRIKNTSFIPIEEKVSNKGEYTILIRKFQSNKSRHFKVQPKFPSKTVEEFYRNI